MARLPYLSAEDLDPDDRALLDRPINLVRALAHSPRGLELMAAFGSWIRHDCELDPRLRELAILQVGYLSRSEYEFSHHVQIGRTFGVSDSDVQGLVADTNGEGSDLSERDRVVLRAARQLTEGTTLDDETWTDLTEHFTAPRLVDLVLVITHYAQVVRVLGALRIDVEDEYRKYVALLG